MKPLNLTNLIEALAEALANSSELAAIDTRFRVQLGFDSTEEKAQTYTPSAMLLPGVNDERSGQRAELSASIEMRLHAPGGVPATTQRLYIYHSPAKAMAWETAVRSVVKARLEPTDARAHSIKAEYNFTELAAFDIVLVTLTITVTLPSSTRPLTV